MSAASRSRLLRCLAAPTTGGGTHANGGVVYWMSRDQRVQDNWALLHARDLALQRNAPLAVVFCLAPGFPGATLRTYDFMLHGLNDVAASLHGIGIPFVLLPGDPTATLAPFAEASKCDTIITDFSPMPIKRFWLDRLLGEGYPATATKAAGSLPPSVGEVIEVDAHNIVPCWVASDRREVGARTFRPRVWVKAVEFFNQFPARLTKENTGDALRPWPRGSHVATHAVPGALDLPALRATLRGVDESVFPLSWLPPGETHALRAASGFCVEAKLKEYNAVRNDPTRGAQSDLSPYLHYGHVAPQRVALLAKVRNPASATESFLEELVVRRELSDNYMYYSPSTLAAPSGVPPFAAQWAVDTLAQHKVDKREYLYSDEEFEYGITHDELWNAAQHELVFRGKIHGFMRMYWAKKILEWTLTAEKAYALALHLNDKYSLDGRDPNGVVGVAWSIYGVHDMGWTERTVFGKVRFMNYAGCKRKFDIAGYVAKVNAEVAKVAATHGTSAAAFAATIGAKQIGLKPAAVRPASAAAVMSQRRPKQPTAESPRKKK